MLSNNHLALGVIAATIAMLCGLVDEWLALALIIGSIAIDLDYYWPSNTMHRDLLTHAPSIYIVLASLGYIMHPILYWFAIGAIVHLVLDSIDWGVMWLWPVTSRRWFILIRTWEEWFDARHLQVMSLILIAGMIACLVAWPVLHIIAYIASYLILWRTASSRLEAYL